MTLTDEDKKLAEECGFFIGTNISGINLVVIMKDGFSAHIKDTELALLLHKVREVERERCIRVVNGHVGCGHIVDAIRSLN